MVKRAISKSSQQRGRPASKLSQVVARLRSTILSGEYPPGYKLQSYDELGPMMKVSRATLRYAIGVLKEEGFIESVERSSMFVSRTPPHLARYGLVFREAGIENRFRRALAHVAEEMRLAGTDVVTFHGIYPGSAHPDWKRFTRDVQSHRLAGIICLSQAEYLRDTGALEDKTLPKLAIRAEPQPDFTRIILDNQVFTDRGVDWLIGQGRKRLAMIGSGGAPAVDCFIKSCQSRGIEVRPEWCLTLGLDYLPGAKNIATLLGCLPPSHRPDGLMILDDNYVEHACAGLLAAGLRIPEEMSVAVHCCWPWPVPSILPLMQLGFDAQEVLHNAVNMINAARRHEALSDIVIGARAQDELISYTQASAVNSKLLASVTR